MVLEQVFLFSFSYTQQIGPVVFDPASHRVIYLKYKSLVPGESLHTLDSACIVESHVILVFACSYSYCME